jgi:hypothetical protein
MRSNHVIRYFDELKATTCETIRLTNSIRASNFLHA